MNTTSRHNLAVKPALGVMLEASGGDPIEMMILLESLICGCFLLIVKLGGDEPVMEVVADRVRERMAEIRLKDIEVSGRG